MFSPYFLLLPGGVSVPGCVGSAGVSTGLSEKAEIYVDICFADIESRCSDTKISINMQIKHSIIDCHLRLV